MLLLLLVGRNALQLELRWFVHRYHRYAFLLGRIDAASFTFRASSVADILTQGVVSRGGLRR